MNELLIDWINYWLNEWINYWLNGSFLCFILLLRLFYKELVLYIIFLLIYHLHILYFECLKKIELMSVYLHVFSLFLSSCYLSHLPHLLSVVHFSFIPVFLFWKCYAGLLQYLHTYLEFQALFFLMKALFIIFTTKHVTTRVFWEIYPIYQLAYH